MGSLRVGLHYHISLSCIGEGNGNPLQCSCLENPRDGGAWWAAVYGVAQSRTRLKRLSSSSSNHNVMKCTKLRLLIPSSYFRVKHALDKRAYYTFQSNGNKSKNKQMGLAAATKSLQSCPTLCNPIDGSPPGSSIPGIFQARILEWVAISFSNA